MLDPTLLSAAIVTVLARAARLLASPVSMSMSMMRPRTRTGSMSTVETARGTHAFMVDSYSLHRGLGVGRFVRSATFGVGGYDWSIRFYPAGDSSSSEDYVAAFLELMSTDVAEVMASFDLRLVDQATGESTVLLDLNRRPKAFTSDATKNPSAVSAWHSSKFKKRSELESSSSSTAAFLRDDWLLIECDVTVFVRETTPAVAISPGSEVVGVQVPPSDLSDNLRTLLEEKQGADVTFKVGEEVLRCPQDRACAEFIASANEMGGVVASPGYVHLKKACPAVLVDMLERVASCIMQRCSI